jgi:hypothetical protein
MFTYLDDKGEKVASQSGGDVPLGQTKEFDPGDLGVPDGAMVWSYVFVPFGLNTEAKEGFVYKKGAPTTAAYKVTGHKFATILDLISSS